MINAAFYQLYCALEAISVTALESMKWNKVLKTLQDKEMRDADPKQDTE